MRRHCRSKRSSQVKKTSAPCDSAAATCTASAACKPACLCFRALRNTGSDTLREQLSDPPASRFIRHCCNLDIYHPRRSLLPPPRVDLLQNQGDRLGFQADPWLALIVKRTIQAGNIKINFHFLIDSLMRALALVGQVVELIVNWVTRKGVTPCSLLIVARFGQTTLEFEKQGHRVLDDHVSAKPCVITVRFQCVDTVSVITQNRVETTS